MQYEAGDLVALTDIDGDEFTVVLTARTSVSQLAWHIVVVRSKSGRYLKGGHYTVPDQMIDQGIPAITYTVTDVFLITDLLSDINDENEWLNDAVIRLAEMVQGKKVTMADVRKLLGCCEETLENVGVLGSEDLQV